MDRELVKCLDKLKAEALSECLDISDEALLDLVSYYTTRVIVAERFAEQKEACACNMYVIMMLLYKRKRSRGLYLRRDSYHKANLLEDGTWLVNGKVLTDEEFKELYYVCDRELVEFD